MGNTMVLRSVIRTKHLTLEFYLVVNLAITSQPTPITTQR